VFAAVGEIGTCHTVDAIHRYNCDRYLYVETQCVTSDTILYSLILIQTINAEVTHAFYASRPNGLSWVHHDLQRVS